MKNSFNNNAFDIEVLRSTQHFAARQQQRGIPDELIDLILKYGKKEHTTGSGFRYSLDSNTNYLPEGKARKFCDKLGKRPYVIVVEDVIVTTGLYYQRIQNDYCFWKEKRRRKYKRKS